MAWNNKEVFSTNRRPAIDPRLIIETCSQCFRIVTCNSVGICNKCYWGNITQEKNELDVYAQGWGRDWHDGR